MTLEQLNTINPSRNTTNATFYPWLIKGFKENGMEGKPLRIAAFLANALHESQGFTRLIENLNYTSERRLKEVFGYRLKQAGVEPIAVLKQPEKLANIVYANRMGNGSIESGDGYKYRGRGIFQNTGKAQYQQLFAELKVNLIDEPDLLCLPHHATDAAFWFWMKHGLNNLADRKDIKGITRVINGGTHGLPERVAIFDKIIGILR